MCHHPRSAVLSYTTSNQIVSRASRAPPADLALLFLSQVRRGAPVLVIAGLLESRCAPSRRDLSLRSHRFCSLRPTTLALHRLTSCRATCAHRTPPHARRHVCSRRGDRSAYAADFSFSNIPMGAHASACRIRASVRRKDSTGG